MSGNEFKLSDNFLNKYKKKQPPFGFGGLGEFVFYRTYSRQKEDGKNEAWWETVKRVVEGTYEMQRRWIDAHRLGWNPWKAQHSAQEMYDNIFNLKFTPPGRGLWMAGSDYVMKRGVEIGLFNCSFVSTEFIDKDFTMPFCFLMDASMVGVGVGFDVKGEGKIVVKGFNNTLTPIVYQIPDDREGWVESVRLLLDHIVNYREPVEFDYSLIRPGGLPIKGFGGITSGPDPLIELHKDLINVYVNNVDMPITMTTIVDTMNMIGRCVVSGNVRRTAEIVFGPYDVDEYLDLKNYEVNPDRNMWGWTSNNSVYGELGIDYNQIADRIAINGEPGFIWMDNVRAYGRMVDPPNWKDKRAVGANPCQPAWAPVLTKNGITPLSNVEIGTEIWDGTNFTKVTDKWSTGVKKVYAYHTNAGVFYGTRNHRIMSNGEKIEVSDAESIDVCSGPTNYIDFDNQSILDGLVIGDGCLNTRNRGKEVLLIIGDNDEDYFEDPINELIHTCKDWDKEKKSYVVNTTITPEELPPVWNRTVPDRYFYGNNTKVASFLRGLYSANGSICGSRVTLKTTSFTLLRQVQQMLSSIGIISYYTTNKPSIITWPNGVYTSKESYDLNISTDRDKFSKQVGFIQMYKQEKLQALCDSIGKGRQKITYDITNVEFISEEEVFDITVDSQEHLYWTGGLKVSNCNEQSLEHMELCCLVETYPNRHASLDDFLKTVKYAYLYGKTTTLAKTHWSDTNKVMLRNRRIGLSMSGIAQFIAKHGIEELRKWSESAYEEIQRLDEIYSEWFAIPRSIKTTSIKPSGTVSLLAGATPGVHYPESRFYIRRVRIAKNSPLLKPLEEANFTIEPAAEDPEYTVVVEFPVDVGEGVKTLNDASMWEQTALAAFMQRYWADNQVSCTVSFNPETEGSQIADLLNFYQYQLKGISFLPKHEQGAYAQMPYEAIDEFTYKEKIKNLKKPNFKKVSKNDAIGEMFCTNDTCELPQKGE